MHKQVMQFVIECCRGVDFSGKRVLEVGSQDVNGSVASFIKEECGCGVYVGTDIMVGDKVDIVCPAEKLVEKFGENSFDVVISCEAFEHIYKWREAMENIDRVLRPGGLLILTARGIGFGKHDFPHDYWRYTTDDFKEIFQDNYEILDLKPDPHPKAPGVFFYGRKLPSKSPLKIDSKRSVYSIGTESTICLCIPSRERPNGLNRTIATALKMAKRPELLKFSIVLDWDDKSEYKIPPYTNEGCSVYNETEEMALPKWRKAQKNIEADIYMLAADDIEFKTQGWDERVKLAFDNFEDNIGLVHCNDGWHNGKLATHMFVTNEWIKAVGFFIPEGFVHNFVDNVWTDIARQSKREVFLGDVLIDHLHPAAHGKGKRDRIYMKVKPFFEKDRQAYIGWKDKIEELVKKISS